jgi:hypothetical protein
MGANNMAEILELVKTAQTKAVDDLTKNFTQPVSATTGMQGYDLTIPSKKLYPVLTPLRNSIPRLSGGFAIQANWRAVTGINSTRQRIGVSEGNRGGAVQHTMAEYFAAYRGYGLEKNVSFEADYAAAGFEDVKALAVQQTLESTMIGEELNILGGNTSQAVGTTPTPTLVGQTTGGSLAAATYSVICVGLGLQAYWDVAGANNGNTGQSLNTNTATVQASITRTNTDASVDTFGGGVAQKSAAASVITTGSTSSIQASVAAMRGVVAYAWYLGTINSVVLTASPGGGAQLASTLPASDNSTSALEFDGLLTIAQRPSLNGYYLALPTGTPGVGTSLTMASGRIVEIDAALATFYDQYRLQPNEIHMNYRQFQRITNLVLGATNPNVQFTVDPNSVYEMIAGRNVGKYVSPITGQIIELIVHPNMPPGMLFFRTTRAPAYLDGVTDMCRMRMRKEYYQMEWPLRSRRYEYGVYADGVLQHFFPPSMGVIANIAN